MRRRLHWRLPKEIVNLDYEELCDFYFRHYTPSNCVVVLYGKIDYAKMLEYLDENFFSKYEIGERFITPKANLLGKKSEVVVSYPVVKGATNKACYFAYAIALPYCQNSLLQSLTLRVLSYVLISSPMAYLKSSLTRKGIVEDCFTDSDDTLRNPWFAFVGAYAQKKDKALFSATIEKTLKEVVENGIEKDRLFSVLQSMEFNFCENDYGDTPKGVVFATQLIPKLFYGDENPFDQFEMGETIQKLKQLAETDYFENFIKQNIIDNPNKAVIILQPDSTLSKKRAQALWETCMENGKTQEIKQLIGEQERLDAYQCSDDVEEQNDLIPLLDLDRLSIKNNLTPTQNLIIDGMAVMFQSKKTNGIGYLDMMFDFSGIPNEFLPYVGIFIEAFGLIGTKRHTGQQLSAMINENTGGIYSNLHVVNREIKGEGVVPMISWHSRYLYRQAKKVSEINSEILRETDFSDTEHLKEIIFQMKSKYTERLLNAPYSVVNTIGMASFLLSSRYEYEVSGYGFYGFLSEIAEHFEERKQELVQNLEHIRQLLFSKQCWRFAYTGEESSLEQAKSMIEDFLDILSEQESGINKTNLALNKKQNLGLCCSSQVQCVALCGMLSRSAVQKRGHILVLEHLLNCDYLWQKVRVEGGAYGGFASFDYSGEVCFVSDRDPNLKETITAFLGVSDYVKNLSLNERTLQQYIIGTMNKLDTPHSVYSEASSQINMDLCRISREEVERIRKQVIDTTEQDIKNLLPFIDEWLKTAKITVIGNQEKITPFKRTF